MDKEKRVELIEKMANEHKVLYSEKVFKPAGFNNKSNMCLWLLRNCDVRIKPPKYKIKLKKGK